MKGIIKTLVLNYIYTNFHDKNVFKNKKTFLKETSIKNAFINDQSQLDR